MNQQISTLSNDAKDLSSILSSETYKTREKIMRDQQWDWERYFNAEAELRALELIEIKRGKNGGIKKRKQLSLDFTKFTFNAKKLIEILSPKGDPISTMELRRHLGFSPEEFQTARSEAEKNGVVFTPDNSRSIRLSPAYVKQDFGTTENPIPQVSNLEKELYEGFGEKLLKWAIADQRYQQEEIILEKTAFASRIKNKGKWTIPDYTLVTSVSYPYLPGRYIEVLTFEVKTSTNWNIESVFEAASHSRGATHSYLAIHNFSGLEKSPLTERIWDECKRFGIGLISFDKEHSNSLEVLMEAEARAINPESTNNFLETILNNSNLEQLKDRITTSVSVKVR